MTYSIKLGKYKLMFSDSSFKPMRKKPTISVYDEEKNCETKIASFNIDKGMNATIIDGVVEVISADYHDVDRMRKILKKAGYKDSYGWKMLAREQSA